MSPEMTQVYVKTPITLKSSHEIPTMARHGWMKINFSCAVFRTGLQQKEFSGPVRRTGSAVITAEP